MNTYLFLFFKVGSDQREMLLLEAYDEKHAFMGLGGFSVECKFAIQYDSILVFEVVGPVNQLYNVYKV